MKYFIYVLISVQILIFLNCHKDKDITPPPEPRPEGWIALGLEDKTINRLELSGGWLYACVGKDGLFRISDAVTSRSHWQYLGLANEKVLQPGLFGVQDVVILNDTIVCGIRSGNLLPEISGIYRSVDDGLTWSPSDSGFIINEYLRSSSVVLKLAQSPLNPKILLAGCAGETVVYLSTNLGLSWKPLYYYYGTVSFYTLGFHPHIKDEIWAGGRTTMDYPLLFRSTDFGQTWQSVLNIPYSFELQDSVNDIVFDPEDNETVYVCLDDIILKTTDSGENWFTSLDTVNTSLWNLSINPTDAKELIACAALCLYKTIDEGNNWTVFETLPENVNCMKDLVVDWETRSLYVSTYNPSKGVYKLYF